MTDYITLRGWVGTEPTYGVTSNGNPYARFRMSVNDGYFDRGTQAWNDGHTSWYNVCCYNQLAENVARSIRKGQKVIALGRLRIKNFQRQDGSAGMDVDLYASAVGHDLAMGVSTWNRRRDETPAEASGNRPGLVDGVGVVDPVTGEVQAPGQDEDPFGAEVPPFEEDAEAGPEEELLSA